MPAGLHPRFRIMLWLDETGGPLQVATAKYIDGEKLTESTRTCGPFDSAHDVFVDAVHTLDVQLALF